MIRAPTVADDGSRPKAPIPWAQARTWAGATKSGDPTLLRNGQSIRGFAYIEGVRRRMKRQRWDVVEEYDYIRNPKSSGYRGFHVVVLRKNRLIEIQLRTEAQHRWAETVEQLGSRTGYNLKDGQGPKELLLYLERGAYGTSLQESGLPLPDDFRIEFAELTRHAQPFLVRR